MNRFCLFIFFLVGFVTALHAQPFQVKWDTELKIESGSRDLRVVYCDQTGYYVLDGRQAELARVIMNLQYSLVKYDFSGNEVYSASYKKELRDYAFHSLQVLNDELYLFVYIYEPKEKYLTLSGLRLDKQNGAIKSAFMPMGGWTIDPDREDNVDISPAPDKSGFQVKVRSGRLLSLGSFNAQLRREKNIAIRPELDPVKYYADDIYFDNNQQPVIVFREFDITKDNESIHYNAVKRTVFQFYDETGKKIREISQPNTGAFLSDHFLLRENDSLFLAVALSTADKGRNTLSGLSQFKINVHSGQLISAQQFDLGAQSFPMRAGLLSKEFDPVTGRYVFFYESYRHKQDHSYFSLNGNDKREDYLTDNYGELVLLAIDKTGGKPGVVVLPKLQEETHIGFNRLYVKGLPWSSVERMSYKPGNPGLASVKYLLSGGSAFILLNDNPANGNIKDYRGQPQPCDDFKKSGLFGLRVNLADMSITRKLIGLPEDELIPEVPRGFAGEKGFYLFSQRKRYSGKERIKMGLISIQ